MPPPILADENIPPQLVELLRQAGLTIRIFLTEDLDRQVVAGRIVSALQDVSDLNGRIIRVHKPNPPPV